MTKHYGLTAAVPHSPVPLSVRRESGPCEGVFFRLLLVSHRSYLLVVSLGRLMEFIAESVLPMTIIVE